MNFDKWTWIYVFIKGKDTKIDPKSFPVNVWLRNVNPVQLRSSIKFLKEVYKKIKQIQYKNWGIDTCSKRMDMDLWNSEKWLTFKFKYRSAKMPKK